MKAYIRDTTALLEKAAAAENGSLNLDDAYNHGQKQLENLQHERLAHLLVMLLFAEGVLITFALFMLLKMVLILALCALFLVLLVPYIGHYYFLENTCQKWYGLLQRIYEKMTK